MPGGPLEEQSCLWRYKKSGGLGSKNFCIACNELEALSASTLRRKIAAGDIILEGLCLDINTNGGTAAARTSDESASGRGTNRRGSVARFVAGATGKMHAERSKPSKVKARKRRKSVEDARRAADVLKREMIKQREGKVPKHGLLRRTVAFVAGKENIVVPNISKRKATNDGEKHNPSKATKYRHVAAGAAVFNGAAKLFCQKDPDTFRADAMRASLKTKLETQEQDQSGKTNSHTTKAIINDKEEEKLDATRVAMCNKFIESMKALDNRPAARRPYLACFAACKRPDVEKLCGFDIWSVNKVRNILI